MEELAGVQARLEAILEPFRGQLETFEIYGVPMLRRPGARAHDWFAGVSPGNGVIRFFLLPMYGHPELLEGVSPGVEDLVQPALGLVTHPGWCSSRR